MTSWNYAEILVAGLGGGLIGALLPTPTYRMSVEFQTHIRDTCTSCEQSLKPGVRGWVRLRNHCSACGVLLGPHPAPLAAVTALCCAGMAARFGLEPAVVPFLLIIPLGCLLGAIDIACLRLPEALVWPSIGVSAVAFVCLGLVTLQWSDTLRAGGGALALGLVYLLLALVPGAQLGLGDVTLAILLGMYLGWLGWGWVVLGGIMPFLVNVPFALWVLIVRKGGRKAEMPFGPAILIGVYLTVVVTPLFPRIWDWLSLSI